MNEEILTEEVVEETTEETVSRETELEAALAAAESENAYLKAKCVCAELGVPAGMTEDVICLGRFYAEKDGVEFEEAARAAFGRISASGGGITTGVPGEKSKSDSFALRKAFGLKG
ncbi:MAG: hypothetical protein PUI48_11050 [Oscillospiraceae bacterium]|nr:hypothetical protein [Oscillospiraceae bacterium]MDY6209309.1 hypothetical protein [Oscillospiraceae bacterium]